MLAASTNSDGRFFFDALLPNGKPAKGVTVSAIFASPEDRDSGEFEPARTDAEGRFQLRGVPPVPVRVGAFQKAADGAATPERAFYYPAAITTHDGSQDPNIEIQVPNRW